MGDVSPRSSEAFRVPPPRPPLPILWPPRGAPVIACAFTKQTIRSRRACDGGWRAHTGWPRGSCRAPDTRRELGRGAPCSGFHVTHHGERGWPWRDRQLPACWRMPTVLASSASARRGPGSTFAVSHSCSDPVGGEEKEPPQSHRPVTERGSGRGPLCWQKGRGGRSHLPSHRSAGLTLPPSAPGPILGGRRQ